MEKYLLGIDIGTSAVKATICSSNGYIAAQASAPCHISSPEAGWAEEAPEEWWTSTISAVKGCMKQLAIDPTGISGIGVAGMVPAVVLLDKDFEVIRPSMQQNDARAINEIQELEEKIGKDRFFSLTGSLPSQQSVGAKLMWVKKHEPENFSRIRVIFGSYDYINYRLTGVVNVEANWALESGLYDINKRRWSAELLNACGIDYNCMPMIRHSHEIIGTLSAAAAEQLSIPSGIPVVAGSADHVAAAFAAGIKQNGDMLIKFGSAGDILYHCDKQILDKRLFIDYHDIPGKYLLNGCMATSGSLLKWFVTEFCRLDKEQAEAEKKNAYAVLDAEAAKISAGSNGLLVLPYFLGEKTPIFDPEARGVFYGMTLYHTRHHLYRAILEAVCFGFKHHVQVLNERGLDIKRVVMSEGGAVSPLWRQIAADVIEMPVAYLKNNPGASLAAAYIAGMATGVWNSWNDIEVFIETENVCEPIAGNSEVYRRGFELYLELYSRLKGLGKP